ncbi:hypothetical protein HPB51_012877 [Rhipicephalus microplus]|uniref:THAP-type domain-containing protein n=1 Tax=Rhipicephalus microplus TaxID=6941 RepID=A0A9J6DUE3_RHIMP|nr:hypothetical protein HPB51_012877 [Rhipicephalus microplus]
MGKKCFAPRCKTGYKSCTKKLSLFSAPREERLRVWRNAIPRKDRILQSTDHLCERHFEPHLVSKTWVAVYNGNVLCRAPRKASLSKDAVPTIFPDCPRYLSKKEKQRKRPAERRDINGSIKKHRKQSQELGDSLLLDPPESGATASGVLLHDCTSAPLAAVSTFDELFGSPASVEVPSTTWGFHRLQVDELRNVVFSELRRVRESQCAADTSHIVPWKLLEINQDMQLSVVLMGRPVSPEVLGFDLEVSTINDITTLLKNLENLHHCGGGQTANEYPHAQLECALVDVCGRWRHRKCAQVLSANGACQRCAGLSDTLRVHQKRALLRKNEKGARTIFRMSNFRNSEKVRVFRRAQYALKRAKDRLTKRIKGLQQALKTMQDQFASISNKSLQEKLEKLDVPNAQLMVIHECIAAAKATGKKNRRYTENWLLLCLVLHIRSPSTYAFLRNNHILPLPCVSNVRKYLSAIRVKCWSDASFFAAFKKKLLSKDIPATRNRLHAQKVLTTPKGKAHWAHYDTLFVEDEKNPAYLKVCPKLTYAHVNPTNTLKMRVKLATQVFSRSVAKGLEFYSSRAVPGLCDVTATVDFTQRMNSLFDALNRQVPKEGLKHGCKNFTVLESSLKWLNEWEQMVVDGKIPNTSFLTQSTANGFRVTIMSAFGLSNYLLNECGFTYVLTGKMNQDVLERFFGIIRQAGDQNEHPTMPTFLQLYNMLSVYSLLKPPKFGKCQTGQEAPCLTLAELTSAFEDESPGEIATMSTNDDQQVAASAPTTAAPVCLGSFRQRDPPTFNGTDDKDVEDRLDEYDRIKQFVREEVARQLSLVPYTSEGAPSTLAPSIQRVVQEQVSEALPTAHAPPVAAPLTYAEALNGTRRPPVTNGHVSLSRTPTSTHPFVVPTEPMYQAARPFSRQPPPRFQNPWRTEDHRPICFACGIAGHVARFCRRREFFLRGDIRPNNYDFPARSEPAVYGDTATMDTFSPRRNFNRHWSPSPRCRSLSPMLRRPRPVPGEN